MCVWGGGGGAGGGDKVGPVTGNSFFGLSFDQILLKLTYMLCRSGIKATISAKTGEVNLSVMKLRPLDC